MDEKSISNVNEQLRKLSNDYYQHQELQKTKQKLEEQIKETEAINNRLNAFRQDPCQYINNNNMDYDFKPRSSTIDIQYGGLGTGSYINNNDQNDIYKHDSRENINNRLGQFNFSSDIQNPNLNNNYIIPQQNIASNNFINNNMIATKNSGSNKKDISNNRLQNYSPLGRTVVNNNYLLQNPNYQQHNQTQNQYISNYKEINNNRMQNFSPLSRTLTIPTNKNNENVHKTQPKTIQNINNYNYNDVNPKIPNSIMTQYPVNSRME